MINFIFRMLLTFNATSLILVVYLIKEQYILSDFYSFFSKLPDFVSYLIYIAIPVLLTLLSLLLSKGLANDSIEDVEGKSSVKEIEQANNAFLPSYLGYFFVALSVTQCETLVFIFGILFVFTFLSQTLYFNPLFLIFGYHFYYVTNVNNVKNFIITRKKLKIPSKESFPKLKRINDYTFIEK